MGRPERISRINSRLEELQSGRGFDLDGIERPYLEEELARLMQSYK